MRLRFLQLSEALRALGHDVRTVVRSEGIPDVATSNGTVGPDTSRLGSRWRRPVQLTSAEEFRRLAAWLSREEPDAVVASHTAYSDLAPWATAHGVPFFIDTHNVESSWQMWRSHRRRLDDQLAIVAAEIAYFRQARRIWTISPRDRDAYAARLHLDNVGYLPFTVPLPARPAPATRAGDRPQVLFVGILSYRPNAEAAGFLVERVLPHLRRRVPEVQVVIVGRDPPAGWRERYRDHPNVRLAGEVPDLDPYYRNASVVAAPVRLGGGVKTKVLEAMAAGRALVATQQALLGVAAEDGVNLRQAPYRARAFADAIAEVVCQPGTAAELGAAARAFVERHHSRSALLRAMRSELERVGLGSAAGVDVPMP